MPRRMPTALLSAVAASLALVACGSSAGGSGAASSPTSASMSHSMSSESMSSHSMSSDSMSSSPMSSHSMSSESMSSHPMSSDSTSSEAMAHGAYVGLAEYEADPTAHGTQRVVYFFHANWCPDCRASDAALMKTGVPEGFVVVKADYDSETELRRKFGVTVQDTFVEVGPGMSVVKKFTGPVDSGQAIADALAA
jgi:thioredoxin 1